MGVWKMGVYSFAANINSAGPSLFFELRIPDPSDGSHPSYLVGKTYTQFPFKKCTWLSFLSTPERPHTSPQR